MGKHQIRKSLSTAQERAILDNSCLRSLAGLAWVFKMAGHYDFENRTKELDELFRQKLKDTK